MQMMSPNGPRDDGNDDELVEIGEATEGDPDTYRSEDGQVEHLFFASETGTETVKRVSSLCMTALARANALGMSTVKQRMDPLLQRALGHALLDAGKDTAWIESASIMELTPFFIVAPSSPSDWDDHGTNPGENRPLQSLLKLYRKVLETGANVNGEVAIIAHMSKEVEPHLRGLLSVIINSREAFARKNANEMGLKFETLALYANLERCRKAQSLVGLRVPTESDILDELERALDSDRGDLGADAEPEDTVVTDTQEPHSTPKRWYIGDPAIQHLAPLVAGIVAVVGTVVYLQIQKVGSESFSETTVSTTIQSETPGVPVVTPLPSSSDVQVAVPFTPVYERIAQTVPDGPDKDLRIAVANEWLVERHESNAHDWTDIRQAHPWKEDPKALNNLLRKLKGWGGYKNPLRAYESAKARGEAPQSISGFLNLVDNDPQLANGTALRIAREIPLIRDEDINDDLKLVEGGHQALNGYVELMVLAVQDEYDEGKIQRPKNVEYTMEDELPDASAYLEEIDDEDDFADLEDLPDLTDELEPLDEVIGEPGSLASLADWTLACQTDLMKKARGANRQLLPGFLEDVAVGTRELATRLNTATTDSEREALVLGQKEAFFSKLTTLRKGDGPYHSAYLGKFAKEYLARLVEALPEVSEEAGVEGVQTRTRRELIATLPHGFFRAS